MSGRFNGWMNLPPEMRSLPQWAVAGASKAPMARGPAGGLRNISVVEPSTWMTFEHACDVAYSNRETITTHVTAEGVTIRQSGFDVGFILNAADPFTCIDLDVKDPTTHPNNPDKWTTPDDFQRYVSIVQHFDSYTERSKSGKGLHTWVRGNIGRGFRRDGIEIYSQERFIISTGDAWIPKPVADREFLLSNMVHQMRPVEKNLQLEELLEEYDDWYILQGAFNAGNREKFIDLWQGNWKEYSFPSQSEADLALMSMFTFYSESNAQCRRLFRESGLGKRDKAIKNDTYINHTLKIIRDRQLRERNVEMRGILAAADNMMQLAKAGITDLQGGVPPPQQVAGAFGAVAPRTVTPLQVPTLAEPVLTAPPSDGAIAQLAPITERALEAGEDGLPWPPGFVGAVAQFIYSNSYLPVKEVSISAALGLMAGICGKAWHIPQSGLNLYIILVARSAIGKEALHTGISTIVSHCIKEFPQFANFVDFTSYASGPALIKACANNSSFVNVNGEWGRKMKRIAMEDDREGAMSGLRTEMTNLYQKSAPLSIVGGIGYSNTDNNVEALQAVAYSMVGESTPGTFYQSLTESMMEDGFMSRFVVISCESQRPKRNPNIIHSPDTALVKYLCGMAFHADTNIGNGLSHPVERTAEASEMLAEFESINEDLINGTNDEARRQMWNRATLKALRIAALLAVGDNYMHPVIERKHAEWAIRIIEEDVKVMRRRLESGDVGLNDTSRERKVIAVITNYLSKPVPASYKVPDEMRQASIIPRPYIQQRTAPVAAFSKHKAGAQKALSETLTNLIDAGYIMEVKNDKLVEMFGYHGRAYRVIRLPDYEALGKDRE